MLRKPPEAPEVELDIPSPEWVIPYLSPCRYKGIKGGRGSGKSHFFAELVVERMIEDPDLSVVCIREIQKSLKFSAKRLIENKIRQFKVEHLFKVTLTEIRRIGGSGIIIFQGMQDHTADSVKSLEDFGIAWVEEAQSLSARSLELLRPTIRAQGSELWFSWNPDQPTDPIETLFGDGDQPNMLLTHVNIDDNPFAPDTLLEEMEFDRVHNPDSFGHVWLGEFNLKSDAQIFNGRWRVDEFEPTVAWDGPYQGLDFGFAVDPTAAVQLYIHQEVLYIYQECGRVNLDLDDTAEYLIKGIKGFEKSDTRADNARPESISYLKRHGLPKIKPVKKWPGSVEDGIEHIKSYKEVVIHTQCEKMQREARLYKYKVNKAGDILSTPEDKENHYWDAVRYALAPLIKAGNGAGVLF